MITRWFNGQAIRFPGGTPIYKKEDKMTKLEKFKDIQANPDKYWFIDESNSIQKMSKYHTNRLIYTYDPKESYPDGKIHLKGYFDEAEIFDSFEQAKNSWLRSTLLDIGDFRDLNDYKVWKFDILNSEKAIEYGIDSEDLKKVTVNICHSRIEYIKSRTLADLYIRMAGLTEEINILNKIIRENS